MEEHDESAAFEAKQKITDEKDLHVNRGTNTRLKKDLMHKDVFYFFK